MSDWNTIETAPRDGSRLLLYQATPGDYGGVQTVGRWHIQITRYRQPDGTWLETTAPGYWLGDIGGFWPTHWMPLPAPPQEDSTSE